ncbi:patatin-like protein 2 [Dorcoceras hygrometricum]|uniref:Patatin-like protein 2 n=1 Tax=Dorcoceras hygrometricum TaxID=472368 RepID=A0A2Z7AMS3_9LAMI|nr:patatin-like protein 2 [Dorcoceras hygrometricum]
MDDAGLVAVFEALVETGLKDFLGCPAIYYKAALTEFFENSSVRDGMVVSTIRGMTVEISENVFAGAFQLPMDGLTDCLKEMNIEFRLLSDILAKTIFVKAGSFDAVTRERFLLMTAIISGVKINWSRLLFDILKDMATPGSRQAKGFAIQICVVLKDVPGLELGDFKAFPSPRIMTEKTVQRYVVINEKGSGEEVAYEPRVKKTPIKKAASKKRPAVAAAKPVVMKKRTTKGKSVSSKENLEILPVAQEVVPL